MANQVDDISILNDLENLVKETFMLWDEIRVGFSWRYYFFNHTQRVRKLSLTIGKQEGADLRKLEYAALLHDITKRYDGDFLTDKDGKRVINEDGFWLNQMLMPNPNKSNIITQLYSENKLEYKIHNESGAIVAKLLLKKYGLPDDFCEGVADAISAHLKPNESSTEKMQKFMNNLEGRIIYEADTIDSNLGLCAFFRNIGIHTHSMVQRSGNADLKTYIEGIPKWLNMKEDFLPNMQTNTGRKIGEARQKRNWYIWSLIEKEKENFEINEIYGILGVIKYFMSCHEDPSLTEQMNYVDDKWIPERKLMLENENSKREIAEEGLKRAIEFNSLLRREVEGEI
ncbi:TPA: HD domain-containing protein [Candidatus Poribacteria bacterium]|nr:HD domain-containing protein [Candidatus Poribacteria bacterium]